MKSERFAHSFGVALDETGDHRIFVRFVFGQNESDLESFAVVFVSRGEEIVRFDGNLFEPVNVHRFYRPKKQKQVLDKPLSWPTVQDCISDIQRNWLHYPVQHHERKGL